MPMWRLIDLVVPPILLKDHRLNATDIAVYTFLRYQPADTPHALARISPIPRETFRTSVAKLKKIGWVIELGPAPRGGTIVYPWMPVEVERRLVDELEKARQDVPNFGEWLLKLKVVLVVQDRKYRDNARPAWLVSGDGSGRFEIDIWFYEAGVAIEFQGRHHHRSGGRFANLQGDNSAQIERDNIKAGICARAGVRYIEFTGRDLSFQRIIDKLDGVLPVLLPLVHVLEHRPLMRKLDEMSQTYRNYVRKEELKAGVN